MAQVIKFASDIDGKQFDTEAEQQAYDAGKRNEAEINLFLDIHYPVMAEAKKQGPGRSIARTAIAKWLGHAAGQQPQAAEIAE